MYMTLKQPANELGRPHAMGIGQGYDRLFRFFVKRHLDLLSALSEGVAVAASRKSHFLIFHIFPLWSSSHAA